MLREAVRDEVRHVLNHIPTDALVLRKGFILAGTNLVLNIDFGDEQPSSLARRHPTRRRRAAAASTAHCDLLHSIPLDIHIPQSAVIHFGQPAISWHPFITPPKLVLRIRSFHD